MNIEKQDILESMPPGASFRENPTLGRATITAPNGYIWKHNSMRRLCYDQPDNSIPQLYKDIFIDVSRGTSKQEVK